jgi:ABC-type multidrug transport system fused ATPase/permease subunit
MVKLWLAVRSETMGATVTFFCVLIQVVGKGYISPSAMALAVLYAQTLPRLCDSSLKAQAFLEASMAAVERVKLAIESVPQENYDTGRGGNDSREAAVKHNSSIKQMQTNNLCVDTFTAVEAESPLVDTPPVTTIPPDDWPSEGVLEVSKLSMRYSNKKNNPLVLRNVNFATKSCEKIGIAGRTGGGKSSLMVALFQIEKCEPGTCIKIDGIDISTVPLKILRSRIGIILQESMLFNETIRFNLDPFHQYSDTQIWDVLEVVSLKAAVCNMPGMLDAQVAEGGSNLSHGQRQLICFARAILRKTKVLIMDEATASIDNENDSRIQALLKERFKDSTILTIAHRLNTIIDCDRVLIMDAGTVREYDAPQTLLEKPDGVFRLLWDQFTESHNQK